MRKMLFCAMTLTAMAAFGGGAAAGGNDIVIGVAASLTGPNAVYGIQIKNGAQQAADDINAAGGINGRKIKVVLGDDKTEPKEAVSVANDLVADGARYIVGHWASGCSIPASSIYHDNGVLQISPGSTNPQFTDRGLWNTFRTIFRDDQQGKFAGQYIASHFPDAKVAVVHDKQAYGKGLADETRKALHEQGITEVLYEGITAGEKDYSALISKMRQAGVTFVYFGGYHPEAGLIIRQMRSVGMDAPLMGGDGIYTSELGSIAGDSVAEGTLATFTPDLRKNPNAADVVKEFKSRNFDPETFTLYSYAAMQVLAEAIGKTGSDDPKTVAGAIKKQGPWPTVIGDLSFDSKGDVINPEFTVYTWRKGKGFVDESSK